MKNVREVRRTVTKIKTKTKTKARMRMRTEEINNRRKLSLIQL